MHGLQLLIEQQNKFEAYKSEKARQLEEHVNHLKYLITTEFLSTCPDFSHEIKDENLLLFKYKELTISIQIVNPITEKRQEKEYNLAERCTQRLTIKIYIQRKKDARTEYFEISDVTQYKKNGEYLYKYDAETTENFLGLINRFFTFVEGNRVQFEADKYGAILDYMDR